jgi:hypothetical protein
LDLAPSFLENLHPCHILGSDETSSFNQIALHPLAIVH